MANHEHVAILKEGVEKWNAWRSGTSMMDLGKPDLSGAGLSEAHLILADLS